MAQRGTKVVSEWRLNYERPAFTATDGRVVELQSADAKFPSWPEPYRDGAFRVAIDGRRHGRIFYGETAWMNGARLFDDVVTAIRFDRELPKR